MNLNEREIKISIIMPVYNAGEYLEDTLKSIFSQSFQEFQLICVDDLSTDGLTRDILWEYQKRYKKMQMICLENNIGAGLARNVGFSEAKGEYTIFLDADDVFEEEFLEKMYRCINVNQADVCLCGYDRFYIDNGKKYCEKGYVPDDYNVYLDNREDWLAGLPMAAWNKLCKTQFLIENKIHFQSLDCCNDVFFSCMVMIAARKKCYIKDTPLVHYRINSRTQISAKRNPIDLYKAVRFINDTKRNDDKLCLQWISVLLLKHGIIEMQNCNIEEYNQQFYYLLRDYFTKYSVDIQNNMLSVCIENIRNSSYEKKWAFECTDLLCQLRFVSERLKRRIADEKHIFLWGRGFRGNIFEIFCKEQKIILHGVTDIKDTEIGDQTNYGNRIVSTNFVLQSGGLIIATNKEIYEYLKTKSLKLLNLAEFYAF